MRRNPVYFLSKRTLSAEDDKCESAQSEVHESPAFYFVTLVIPTEAVFHILANHYEKMVGGELMATDEGGYEISRHLSV